MLFRPRAGERLKAAPSIASARPARGEARRRIEIEAIAQRFARHVALGTPDGTLTPTSGAGLGATGSRGGPLQGRSVRSSSVATGSALALDGWTASIAAPYLEVGVRAAVRVPRPGARPAPTGRRPATVALVVDRLTGPDPIHISDVVYRERTRQWWTAGGHRRCPPHARRRADREREFSRANAATCRAAAVRGSSARPPRRRRPRHADPREHPSAPAPEACVHDVVTRSKGGRRRGPTCAPRTRRSTRASPVAADRAALASATTNTVLRRR